MMICRQAVFHFESSQPTNALICKMLALKMFLNFTILSPWDSLLAVKKKFSCCRCWNNRGKTKTKKKKQSRQLTLVFPVTGRQSMWATWPKSTAALWYTSTVTIQRWGLPGSEHESVFIGCCVLWIVPGRAKLLCTYKGPSVGWPPPIRHVHGLQGSGPVIRYGG